MQICYYIIIVKHQTLNVSAMAASPSAYPLLLHNAMHSQQIVNSNQQPAVRQSGQTRQLHHHILNTQGLQLCLLSGLRVYVGFTQTLGHLSSQTLQRGSCDYRCHGRCDGRGSLLCCLHTSTSEWTAAACNCGTATAAEHAPVSAKQLSAEQKTQIQGKGRCFAPPFQK